jgi:hypothetical protein
MIAAARSLVRFGPSALPAIEEVLDSMERQNQSSTLGDGAKWLLLAYGKIVGPAAVPRLRRMIDSGSRAPFAMPTVDRAIALSLGLTSYVSRLHVPPALRMIDGRVFFCRTQEPRDGLDRLIFAWETNDLALLEASLGPRALVALGSLLRAKTWDNVRVEIMPEKIVGEAVGYKLDAAGHWAQPEETLEERHASDDTNPSSADELELQTLFTSRWGKDCGTRSIAFVRVGSDRDGSLVYRVNDSNFSALLRTIATCAAIE